MELLSSSTFWLALGSIILTNIVLSGDNAVVIALASRNLPPAQQKKAISGGSAAAIIMRVVLTVADGSARVDSWLWSVRVFKTRSLATAACRSGHVRVNGERAKAARPVKLGDEVRVRISGFDRVLVVRQTLQTTLDDNIFALGDCAACPWPENKGFVPPRAQAAHQQESMMAKNICRRIAGKPLKNYTYRDYGSLVALGRFSTVGNLMGGLTGGSIMIEGAIARLVYWSLHKMHQVALHGWFKTALTAYAHFISTPTRARIKLH